MMDKSVRTRVELHERWVTTLGEDGVQLVEIGLNFRGGDLDGRVLNGAEIPASDFSEGTLVGADLGLSNLASACFVRAKLSRVQLGKSNLDYADLTGADLRGANLMRASLCEATLVGANLAGAKLVKAFLDDADLRHADLRSCDLTIASFEGARLGGAVLTGATGLKFEEGESVDISIDGPPQLLSGSALADWLRTAL